ncbi:LAME_0F16028g1_1 [Lachancea meyersii CBS 8951]|uniref:LAME_0F16028g1_1 n=1 Tax=Lachancea meyersii CBS 8951 TaxID=1266667 RepID=A0A1G4JZ40_9SACH|nr:LAME_0F16028g1_1 [Lachancea meyersii CBS 8951]
MNAIINSDGSLGVILNLQTERWQETPTLELDTPRSSDAQDQVRDYLHKMDLEADLAPKAQEIVLQRLQMLFQSKIEDMAVQLPHLRSETTVRVKLVVSKFRIREFFELERGATIAALSNEPEKAILIFSDTYHSVMVECPLEVNFLQNLCPEGACMLLPRELVHSIRTKNIDLKASLVSLNSRSVTIKSLSFELVIEDMRRLAESPFYQCPPRRWRAVAPREMLDIYRAAPVVLGMRKKEVITHNVTLNKPEVTFLIGHQGTTIQQIRQESGATIKVIPIAARLTVEQLNSPKCVEQHLSITGDIISVTKAVCLIDARLALYRD